MYLTKLTYNEHVVIKRWWSAVVQVLSGSVCVVYCNGGLLLLAHVLSRYFAAFYLFFLRHSWWLLLTIVISVAYSSLWDVSGSFYVRCWRNFPVVHRPDRMFWVCVVAVRSSSRTSREIVFGLRTLRLYYWLFCWPFSNSFLSQLHC